MHSFGTGGDLGGARPRPWCGSSSPMGEVTSVWVVLAHGRGDLGVGRPRPWARFRDFMGITVLFLNEKLNSVIHWFIPAGRANHYRPSLKACSIVKVDRFESSWVLLRSISSMIRLFDNLQVIANTNVELPDVVGKILSVQGSDLTIETTRLAICLLIEP
uniref:Uncharacterized protein n=1 Tax=Brassica oleracea var. oleracea TaxID=109376 RepID=A0A0D3E8Z4_BRAOL